MTALTGLPKAFLDAADLTRQLELECAAHPNGQKGWAKDHGVSPAYVNDILHGRREISDRIALELGYVRRSIFIATEAR